MNIDNEQFRPGFEAWARGKYFSLELYSFPEYRDGPTQRAWEVWTAAKRDASTEPSAGYGPVHIVGDLVSNLLTLDQSTPIYAAFHVDYAGERRCRTRHVSVSRERVIDGKWVDPARTDVPYAVIVWARPQADESISAALPDEATPQELGAQVAANRDKARLDFLDGNARFRMGWQIGIAPIGCLSVKSIIMGGKPIREAIDAAIEAQKGGQHG